MLRLMGIAVALAAATLSLVTAASAAESSAPIAPHNGATAVSSARASVVSAVAGTVQQNASASLDPRPIGIVNSRRIINPDYSRALSPAQIDGAWNTEIDRVFWLGVPRHTP